MCQVYDMGSMVCDLGSNTVSLSSDLGSSTVSLSFDMGSKNVRLVFLLGSIIQVFVINEFSVYLEEFLLKSDNLIPFPRLIFMDPKRKTRRTLLDPKSEGTLTVLDPKSEDRLIVLDPNLTLWTPYHTPDA